MDTSPSLFSFVEKVLLMGAWSWEQSDAFSDGERGLGQVEAVCAKVTTRRTWGSSAAPVLPAHQQRLCPPRWFRCVGTQGARHVMCDRARCVPAESCCLVWVSKGEDLGASQSEIVCPGWIFTEAY